MLLELCRRSVVQYGVRTGFREKPLSGVEHFSLWRRAILESIKTKRGGWGAEKKSDSEIAPFCEKLLAGVNKTNEGNGEESSVRFLGNAAEHTYRSMRIVVAEQFRYKCVESFLPSAKIGLATL